jgi:hypothetical protein
MLNKESAKAIIKDTVKSSIIGFAQKSLTKKAKFQVLDLIIPKERKIRSIVGGLETSLGTTLWEPLAKALALHNGFEVVNKNLECPSHMPSSLNNILQTIIDDRKKAEGAYSADGSHSAIKTVCQSFINKPIDSFEPAPKGRGVDIWLVKDNVNYFFDTKTVQPNLSALIGCMEQVLYWYAYYYSRYPAGAAVARIVFPYNPHHGNFWEKIIGKGKPLERDNEAWVEGQFWDFCSGLNGTYKLIEEAFSELRTSGELEESLHSLLG